jgi:phage terminase Nu1 subunit (DNA packaging protein)
MPGAPKNARAAPLAAATRARGRLASMQAKLVEAKLGQLSGELVPAAAVEMEWTGILRAVRAGCLAIPARVAQRLPHLSKADVAAIDIEIRAVLTELAGAKRA